ncbi:MAG TPA: YfhO family protein, partial [Myxococcales bacterium]|nr:YfhO family protein [Myxococcales bacterium]
HRDLAVYRNPAELPPARLMGEVTAVADEDAAVAALRRLDARRAAVVEGPAPADAPLEEGESASVDSFRPGALAIVARAARERLLLVSEVWHPGWSATLDGQPASILKADVALMGVVVPAGEHRVSLRFRPLHLWPAVCLTALSALACLVLARRR